ncbi:DinB family protein [Caulifigura coniformis]|uniref:DinB family protein n=1 Tax=Caulifigura coniformis TaxID=2527983 RepID=A0A517SKM3_9PLAN|nr:DinB family protein [Caulifigura coniformis]QDT56666.1 DinB family protein [Caulifigura coniformis]
MTMAQTLIPEYDQETANTRKVLERVPDDKFDWKAHPKSHTMGWVANHLAEGVGWIEGIVNYDNWDVNPPGGPKYQSPDLRSTREVLASFDSAVVAGRKALQAVSDADFQKEWALLDNGKPIISMPRAAMVRIYGINHLIHHRAFLCSYLRLNNIPVPGMYGPSGDE